MKILPRRLSGALVLLPLLMANGGVSAQDAAAREKGAAQSQAGQQQTSGARPLNAEQLAQLDVRASALIGMDVKNGQGENLGKIEDLVLDLEHARVRYVVLAYGGVLGLGDRLAAFPASQFRPGQEQGELLLNVSREQIEKAPTFESKAWPDWNDQAYRGNVDRFFLKGDEVVRDGEGGRLARASDVVGKDVSDGGNRHAGSLEDLVVNLGNGQIRYAVLNFSNRAGIDQRLVPLPVHAFRFPSRPELPIFLLLDRDRVAKARAFDKDDWPDLNEARSRGEVDGWLSQFAREETEGKGSASGGETRKGEAGAENR